MKLDNLSSLASHRKTKLLDNSAYLQFMWKADVVESWIADKETHVRSEEYGRDLSTVQTLLTKQETFDAGMIFFVQSLLISVKISVMFDGLIIWLNFFQVYTRSNTKVFRI